MSLSQFIGLSVYDHDQDLPTRKFVDEDQFTTLCPCPRTLVLDYITALALSIISMFCTVPVPAELFKIKHIHGGRFCFLFNSQLVIRCINCRNCLLLLAS